MNSKSPNYLAFSSSTERQEDFEASPSTSSKFSNVTAELGVPMRVPETVNKEKKNPSGKLNSQP